MSSDFVCYRLSRRQEEEEEEESLVLVGKPSTLQSLKLRN